MAYSHNSIGNIYAAQNKHKEALISFEKAFALWKSIDYTPGYVGSYISIAEELYKIGSFDKSKENYLEACAMSIKLDDKRGLQSAYMGLAYVLVKKKEFSEAKAYFEKALTLAQKMNAQKKLQDVYEGLSKLELAQGNYESALRNFELVALYKDIIINDDNNQKMLQAQMQ